MKLSELQPGQTARILFVGGKGAFRKRILEMGFLRGKEVTLLQAAPMRDPLYFRVMGYNVSMRIKEAELIDVELLPDVREEAPSDEPTARIESTTCSKAPKQTDVATHGGKRPFLRVALVGNPNCGKTSIFNAASGAHERVGNYSGVTVDAQKGHFRHGGYSIEVVDLPGSYSLSPYSPEELFIRQYLTDEATRPDMVIDVIDSGNLERNLYLTMQIKEMGLRMVVALNMHDELEASNATLDEQTLAMLLDTPLIPTVGRTGRGIDELFDAAIALHQKPASEDRYIRIPYGTNIEPSVKELGDSIEQHLRLPVSISSRYVAVKLLEGDKEVERMVSKEPKGAFILSKAKYEREKCSDLLGGGDVETAITDARYGFISGALRETYRPAVRSKRTKTDRIDHWLIHRWWGFPLFIIFIVAMFQATFTVGAYPQSWIEQFVAWLGGVISNVMPAGPLRDLLVDGVIGGVGGVIVFLPQILILYLFISFMEDTGYMARASFIMDKLMHRMGLHGKSFIPLIMGFGCNVPAVMASRTIESPQSRLITVLVTPLMSCSARLPIYLLLAGAFFPHHAGLVLFALYAVGVLLAVLLARIFRKTLFKEEDVPFVMELPPYRVPTWKSLLIHMWEKSKEYLQKMGTIILGASIIIWALGYFPRHNLEQQAEAQIARVEASQTLSTEQKNARVDDLRASFRNEQQRQSYLGRIGCAIEPVMQPLGFDWKMSIAIVSGLPAKEVVVSTLGVLYTGQEADSDEAEYRLSEKLKNDRNSTGEPTFTPLVAVSFMLFVLLYFPCIATIVAIGRESGSRKWGLLTIVYTCLLAWIVAFVVYQCGLLLGLG